MNLKIHYKDIGIRIIQPVPDISIPRHYWIAMKLTSLLILCFSLVASATVSAQRISLEMKNASFKAVLFELAKQSDINFLYEQEVIALAKPVSISVKSQDIAQILPQLFKDQPLSYSLKGKTVTIISKVPDQNSPFLEAMIQTSVKGKVTDSLGNPLAGVTIQVKGTNQLVASDIEGNFEISNVNSNSTLVFRMLGYKTVERSVSTNGILNVQLFQQRESIEEVHVYVNTGFQSLPKERAAGSFEVIDNKLLNRSVSTSVLDRLNGIVPGLAFQTNDLTRNNNVIQTNPNLRTSPITIRGESTFLASTNPLIVVDNFPFEGEISSINPNDIESVTILRDASAASIWGARSGNGVIVITTKRGKQNEQMKIDLATNLSVGELPDLFYEKRFVDAKSFIDVEQYLFDQGYFNSDINNTSTRPVVSPSVQIMALVRAGTITPEEGQARLDILRNQDIRKDMGKYLYQGVVRQQHNVSLRGGTDNLTYRLSTGFDKNRDEFVGNGFNRFTLNAVNTYSPLKNLNMTTGLNYTQSATDHNSIFRSYSISNIKYNGMVFFPYARLKDDEGNNLPVLTRLSENYLQTAEQLGYKDWRYSPLDDMQLSDNTTEVNSILARFSADYRFIPELSATVHYQFEQQKINNRSYRDPESYYVRDLYNKFSIYNATTQTFTYNYPAGGNLNVTNTDWRSMNFRAQLNFDKQIQKHGIYGLAGFEARELKTEGSTLALIGYDDEFGTSNMTLNYNQSYPNSPSGSSRLPSPGSNIFGRVNRYLSYYANGSYSYDDRYTFTASARTDGANLFGVKTNNRFSPLWSIGAGWNISKESFYDSTLLPYLKIRASYGYNGNTFTSGTALLTGRYSSNTYTGEQAIVSLTAPNSELRWERVKNLNLGVDFRIVNNIVQGTVEYYDKAGIDLVQATDLAPQTGFITYHGNTAESRTKGLDANLTFKILDNQLKWNSTVLYSLINDKVVRYDPPYTSLNQLGRMVGRPLNAVFAYRWAGLNPENGNPVGWLDGEKSEDYNAIYSRLDESDLVYAGSFIPTSYGAFRNDFTYKNVSLSINITCFFNYVFRKPVTSVNYVDQLNVSGYSDYVDRWQKSGDEQFTSVPSLVYPANARRSEFYQLSEVNIVRGDHIRLRDIRLSYDFSALLKAQRMQLNVFGYAQNIAILWRKNKEGIDPQMITGRFPDPRVYSFGINATF